MSELYKDNNDELIPSLSYKNPSTASYIIGRNSSTFHPLGGNTYKPSTGTKTIKFFLAGEDLLDPSSVRVQFDLICDDAAAKTLIPLSAPHAFFSRVRCLARGEVVDDITEYNRVSELFTVLKSNGSVQNDMLESLWYDTHELAPNAAQLIGVKGGEKRTVLFKPLLGLLNQSKYIFLKYVPITIELTLVDKATDSVVDPSSDIFVNTTGVASTVYTAANVSSEWKIENPLIRCDIVKIDSELQNKYDDHFSSGGNINIKYTTYYSQILSLLGNATPSLNVSRSLTYLTRVFVSFLKPTGPSAAGNIKEYWNKDFNCFYHTLREENRASTLLSPKYISTKDLIQSAQLQVGSKLIPDYPITSSAECFYFLRKALNTDNVFPAHIHSVNITGEEYINHRFIMAFDCEKVNGKSASFTGMNVKNGELITLKLRLQSGYPLLNPTDCHIILEAEQVVEISGSYVRVAD